MRSSGPVRCYKESDETCNGEQYTAASLNTHSTQQLQQQPPLLVLLLLHLCLNKGNPTSSTVTLERINGFQRFLAQVFLKQLAIKWLFNLPSHPASASTLPGENRTNEICTEMNNKRQQTGVQIA